MVCIRNSIVSKVNLFSKVFPFFLLTFPITLTYAGNNQDNFRLEKDTELSYLDAESLENTAKKDSSNNAELNTNTATTEQGITVISDDKAESEPQTSQQDSSSTGNAVDDAEEGAEAKYDDPYETYNRSMHIINRQIDRFFIKPIAEFYAHVVPPPFRYMVTNFFENLQDVSVIINDFLQGEYYQVPKSFNRLFLNSTFGIFGLIDVATDVDLPKRTNDFGITFGKWSMADSSYFVIPILGPSTVRDTIGMVPGMASNVTFYISESYGIYGTGIAMVDKRANLLPLEKVVDTMSDDEYIFVRNSYLEYRSALINGAKPNVQKEDKESELLEGILSGTRSSGTDELQDLEPLDAAGSTQKSAESSNATELKELEPLDTTQSPKKSGASTDSNELKDLEPLDTKDSSKQ